MRPRMKPQHGTILGMTLQEYEDQKKRIAFEKWVQEAFREVFTQIARTHGFIQ